MSGVFGIVDSQRQSTSDQLRGMADSLRIFDWTRTQVWSDEQEGVALGQVNIGLFSTDPQPLHSEDGTLAVVFFGELHYTESLRRQLATNGYSLTLGTEAELICCLYQAQGEAFIHNLEGIFVLALWDGQRRCVLVANDRFGLIPTYYAHYQGKLVFSPKVKGIFADSAFEKQLDLTAMAQFFRFQRLLGERTFFKDLNLLSYGSLLRFDQADNALEVSHYWDFDQIPAWPGGATFDDIVEETGRLLRQAVQVRMQGEHRVGVYLSGGLDSRTILGLASQIRPPVPSLTYGVPDCRDVHYARRIARRVGSPHHFFPQTDGHWIRQEVDHHLEITEGFTTWIHGHAGSILKPTRALIDVNLTGVCGSILKGGAADYSQDVMHVVDDVDFYSRVFYYLTQTWNWPGYTEGEFKCLFSPEFYPSMRDQAFQSLVQELQKFRQFNYADRLRHFGAINHRTRSANFNVNVYARAYFEASYPFYDYALVDFVCSIPLEYRLNERLYLAVINREIPEVTWVPRDKDEMLLTDHQFIRQAHGLWQKVHRHITGQRLVSIHEDPEGWLRRDLRDWAEDLLFSPRTLERGFYNPAFLRSIFERHMSGREVHTIGKIAPIMTFEMMLRRLYD